MQVAQASGGGCVFLVGLARRFTFPGRFCEITDDRTLCSFG